LAEWVFYCPEGIRGRIADVTAAMTDRMAFWAERNWKIENETDLDVYTFAVAGSVGLILCEIWEWFEGVKTDRNLTIGYGRGLQSVNILRNSGEDKERGVTFYPPGWTQQ
jgi:farnesyl-diphosphate farnesyltransferase